MVTRWDPFAEAMSLRDAMNRLFETSVVRPASWASVTTSGAGATFPLNIYTQDENLIVEALLPGVSLEDVQVSVDQGVLSIAAKRHGWQPAEGQEAAQQPGWYLREIVGGQFRRAFSLPFPVDADKAQATYTNGVLTLTLPKAEAARPKQIRIEAGAPQIEATTAQ
jgi:HSP20 family protein